MRNGFAADHEAADDRRAKIMDRYRRGACVCCGTEDRAVRLSCGCVFCAICADRGHADHGPRFAVQCAAELME